MVKLLVIYGSYRQDRNGITAAEFVMKMGQERGHEMILIDAKHYDLPILDRMYKEMKNPSEKHKELATYIAGAHGYVFVTGEYNHAVQPGLKNLIDHFQKEWFWKPSGIVSYSTGSFGGVRAAMNMRVILPEVGMPSIPSILPIPNVGNVTMETAVENERLVKSATKFFDELIWYVNAFAAQREKGVPY